MPLAWRGHVRSNGIFSPAVVASGLVTAEYTTWEGQINDIQSHSMTLPDQAKHAGYTPLNY